MDIFTLNIIAITVITTALVVLYFIRRHLKRRLDEIDAFCGIVNADNADIINIPSEK